MSPGSFGFFPFDTGGFLEAQAFADPAAGANFVVALPASVVWLPYLIACRLATSAAAATRRVRVEFTPTATGIVETLVQSPLTEAASLSYQYTFQRNPEPSAVVANSQVNLRLPLSYMVAGTWGISVDNLQAADQISTVQMVRQTWRVP